MMNIPLPDNKIVALTIAGGLLTALVAVGLSVPGWFGNPKRSPGPQRVQKTSQVPFRSRTSTMADRSKSIESNSPRPRKNFKPAVKTNPPSGEAREDEEYEEWEHGREEHENDDERDRERREYGEFDHEE